MPLSGSYFYPGLNAPNSSYPTLDLRGLDSIPPVAGVGRLFVLSSSQDLYYEDADGNVVVIGAATGSAVYDVIDVNKVFNSRGHLILSSSASSVVAISSSLLLKEGNLQLFMPTGQSSVAFQYRANNGSFLNQVQADTTGRLAVYSSGDGTNTTMRLVSNSVSVSRADPTERLTVSGNVDLTDQGDAKIYARNAHLVLSSSAGSQVTVSGNTHSLGLISSAGNATFGQELRLNGAAARLLATQTHLILSSSVGSHVHASGAFKMHNATTGSILVPHRGAMIWHTTTNQLVVYNGTSWFPIASGTAL